MAKGIAHRDWAIRRDDYRDEQGRLDEAAFRNAVQVEMSLAEHIGERLGVAIVAAPARRRYPGGGYYTAAWLFRTDSVPSVPSPGAPATPRAASTAPRGEETRPMVGPGGEEADIPESAWSARIDDGWEFDDEDDDIDVAESLLERAE